MAKSKVRSGAAVRACGGSTRRCREITPGKRRSRPIRNLLIGLYSATVAHGASPCLAQSTPPSHRADPPPTPPASAPPGQHDPALSWTFLYTSDANADVSGGTRTGAAYLQRIGVIADVDLHTAIGWRGARAHVSGHLISGTGLSASRVGNILTVSGVEAEPAARLFNLWIEQKLGDRVVLRIGQFNVDQQFAISPTASLLVNSGFGWPGSFAIDLPSGGPAYPLAGPGASLVVTPGDRTTIRLAAFSGDPAGQGGGDPQRRDRHGVNGWRLKGHPFVIGEIARSAGGDDPAWSILIGGWAHLDRFDDVRFDATGASLADPAATAPRSHAGNLAAYVIGDVRLWHSGYRSLRGFIRATASPADRNAVDRYADAGLALTGAFQGRPKDVIAVGLAVAHLSPRLRALRDDACAIVDAPCRPPAAEMAIEGSYQANLNDRIRVQPVVQWIINPAGALVADPATPAPPTGNAVVLGLRTSIRL